MISLVICSRDKSLSANLRANVELTIGVDFEFICIDNSNNEFGIAQAYNRGGAQAKFPFICFVHEDVIFHTLNWGKAIIKHFESDADLGMIGVAGGSYKSLAPSSWFPLVTYGPVAPTHKRIWQHTKNGNIFEDLHSNSSGTIRVACLDGVWLCCKKDLWEKVRFDESLPGFHCYDVDFSISINKLAKVVVINDILIEHLSLGNYNGAWVKTTYMLHRKWNSELPINYSPLMENERFQIEVQSRERFLQLMRDEKLSPISILFVIWGKGSFRFFSARKFCKWNIDWLKYFIKY